MTNRHANTWRSFLQRITVMGSEKFTEAERAAMVEAISIAAPDGPRGVKCEDGCKEHDDKMTMAIMLMIELLERAYSRDNMSRRELADLRLILSHRDSDLSRVRRAFPNVWNTIEKLIN